VSTLPADERSGLARQFQAVPWFNQLMRAGMSGSRRSQWVRPSDWAWPRDRNDQSNPRYTRPR